MNKYELAVSETQSVLAEQTDEDYPTTQALAHVVVQRLVAKGVIQSTTPGDLVDARGESAPEDPIYRSGPLRPGRTIVGGVHDEDEP